MSDYSGYQLKRAHSLGPFSSVHEATAPNGGPGRFAVKIFHPPESSRIRRAYAIEGWLLAAERQQKTAKKDGAVLEVLAFGRCAEGAYCVMPWQERSLEPRLTTLAVKGDLLRALAECLLDGLERWGGQTGGAHRKLKASNVFLTRSGPLQGMTVVLSDPWFQYGDRTPETRTQDLVAIGTILAQIVRRREIAGWPIEDGPEWRALGRPAKAWLAYVNFLLDPQPPGGELTIAEARKRLRAIPKDSNPARTAGIMGAAAVFVLAGGVVAFARFGNPIYMPDNIRRLAETVGNPRTISEIPASWALLCRAWDTWLTDLQGNAPRLLRNEKLWSGPDDPLRVALAEFMGSANNLKPGVVVPVAASESRLGVLADTKSEAILSELRKQSVQEGITDAYQQVVRLATRLESWPRWEEMRELQGRLEASGYTRTVAALAPKLTPPRGPGYKLDIPRTLKLFNDISLDDNGALLIARSWSEVTKLTADMKASGDRVQVAMPELILARLADRSSLSAFAELLEGPLGEMRLRRKMFLDPQVVQARFLKDSPLLKETAVVTLEDFPRWEEQIALFTKVQPGDDPRQVPELNAFINDLPRAAEDLEAEAPAPEPGGLPTLSTADFRAEFQARQGTLTTLRAREVVNFDLPGVTREKDELVASFTQLRARLDATLVLLKPETWLEKVALAYGKFNESQQRWNAWKQLALNGVNADALRGAANREKFRGLRRQERQVKEWIDGLEGREGLGGVPAPELAAMSTDSTQALFDLEATRREQAATAAAAAAQWVSAVPATPWAGVAAAVRAPIEAHRAWVAAVPAFGNELDALSELVNNGFGWKEGISEVLDKLLPRPGLDALGGKPATVVTEAKLLGRLFESTNRTELTEAAQNIRAGLSRRLTAWRRLGVLPGWPADAVDLDIDGAVSANLRQDVEKNLLDRVRRASLLEELRSQTRDRWNRAARNAAGNVEQMGAVFERMPRYGIAETDLEENAFYNLKLWQLKTSDWGEVDLAPLKARRDAFVSAVRAIGGVMAKKLVGDFVEAVDKISLVIDPNFKRAPSPRTAKWTEELTDSGLGLTATWKNGNKTVKLDFAIVQPADTAVAPFYLAKRALAVGEFLDLMATRPDDATEVMKEMPAWAQTGKGLPYDQPMAWWRNPDSDKLEISPKWLNNPTAQVNGLFIDEDLLNQNPALKRAKDEKPTARSPLQHIPPGAAKIMVVRMLGARFPTMREWEEVVKVAAPPAGGVFRGAAYQDLFKFLRDYNVAGQTQTWRPNAGAFRAMVPPPGGGPSVAVPDDGQASDKAAGNRLWLAAVDEGSTADGFVNLTGNVWIYLQGEKDDLYYAAGGSAFSPPGADPAKAYRIEAGRLLIGAKKISEGFSDVGVRPAFDAPPGFRERYNFLVLVRNQQYLTW